MFDDLTISSARHQSKLPGHAYGANAGTSRATAGPGKTFWEKFFGFFKWPFWCSVYFWATAVGPANVAGPAVTTPLPVLDGPGLMHRATACLLTSQLSLVIVAPIHKGMARLSLPRWLVTYLDGLFIRLPTIIHLSSNRVQIMHFLTKQEFSDNKIFSRQFLTTIAASSLASENECSDGDGDWYVRAEVRWAHVHAASLYRHVDSSCVALSSRPTGWCFVHTTPRHHAASSLHTSTNTPSALSSHHTASAA